MPFGESKWYAIASPGQVYSVVPAADGRVLVGRSRVSRIPSRQVQLLNMDAARSWINQDLRERGCGDADPR